MSQKDPECIELIREVYRRFSEGDFRASEDLLDPSAVLVLTDVGLWGAGGTGVFVGTQEIASYTRDLVEAWTSFKMEAEELVGSGDSVLVRVHQSGVGRQSGVPTDLRYFTLWSFRARKVIRIESFRDREKAFEAAGLE